MRRPDVTGLQLPEDKDVAQLWKDFKPELDALERAITAELDPVGRKDGKPIEMNIQDVTRMCVLLRRFVPPHIAATCADIAPNTLNHWLRLAEKPGCKPVYLAFRRVFRKAMAECEMMGVAKANVLAVGSFPALAWLMEKRFPQRWGRNAGAVAVPENVAEVQGFQELVNGFAEVVLRFVPEESREQAVLGLQAVIDRAVAAGADGPQEAPASGTRRRRAAK